VIAELDTNVSVSDMVDIVCMTPSRSRNRRCDGIALLVRLPHGCRCLQ
jgi:hypothetical protein